MAERVCDGKEGSQYEENFGLISHLNLNKKTSWSKTMGIQCVWKNLSASFIPKYAHQISNWTQAI